MYPDDAYDHPLLTASLGLLVVGLLMVASSSVAISQQQYSQPFYYLARQSVWLLVSLLASALTFQFPVDVWRRSSVALLLLTFICLVLVLMPGIGRAVNGSHRWLRLGPVSLQVSEFAKFAVIAYLARYLDRYPDQVRTRIRGFLRPLILLGMLAALLLREPDLGAAVVTLATTLGLLFLAGARLLPFAVLLGSVALTFIALMLNSPYRLARLTSFFDPWASPFDSGYQLTQALIAFGRGGWHGAGLGGSIQKLFYLPEAHTDFLFAVLVEETGLIGGLVVMAFFGLIVWRALAIGWRCARAGELFAAYLAWGIGLALGLEALINLGVNTGLLPTKGLTLPLVSYGGSSLLASCLMIAVLLRVDYEYRLSKSNFRG